MLIRLLKELAKVCSMDILNLPCVVTLAPGSTKAPDRKELVMVALIPFAHRRNSDASIDSICTICFQTIASEDSEGKLIAHEERHSCDPYW